MLELLITLLLLFRKLLVSKATKNFNRFEETLQVLQSVELFHDERSTRRQMIQKSQRRRFT